MRMPTLGEWTVPGNELRHNGVQSRPSESCSVLRDAPAGCRARVLKVHSSPAFTSELHSLGFVPGVPVRVLNRNGKASLIVEVLRSRLSLSSEAAGAITIQTL